MEEDSVPHVHVSALKPMNAMMIAQALQAQDNEDEMMKKLSPYESLGLPMDSKIPGRPRTRIRASRMLYLVAAVLLFGVFLTFVNIYELRRLQGEHYGRFAEVEPSISGGRKRPVVWVSGKKLDTGYLKHVFNVFDRIGYLRGTVSSDWDVLWSHDYPFITLHKHIVKLKPHQRVNHFPGSGYVTNKVNLATSNISFIPKAFRIPKEVASFKRYAKLHPDLMWVQKSNNHRGVRILTMKELDLKGENTFIQEYIDDPLLIDGRRFDIGIYTAVTSINPLRIYINHGDWLVRFCPKQYHPFDPAILEKYVVNDNYLPVWQVPSLKKYYSDQDNTFREALLAYLRMKKFNVDQLQRDIARAIRNVYLNQEKNLITAASKYTSSRNFFEMVRFDFVLDSKLKLYLLEVNMSPNLSSGHFPPNRLLYEQVVFGLLNLVGVARSVADDLPQSFEEEADMQVSSKDINVYASACASSNCFENCMTLECRLCGGCMSTDRKFSFKRAYLEHIQRRTWRRVIPAALYSQEEAMNWDQKADTDFQGLSAQNQIMFLWFRGKCLQDVSWCV